MRLTVAWSCTNTSEKQPVGLLKCHVPSILVFVGSQQCVDGNAFLFSFLDCLKRVFGNLLCRQYAILTVLEPGVLLSHRTAHKAHSGVDLYMLLTLCSLIVFCRGHI